MYGEEERALCFIGERGTGGMRLDVTMDENVLCETVNCPERKQSIANYLSSTQNLYAATQHVTTWIRRGERACVACQSPLISFTKGVPMVHPLSRLRSF